MYLLELIFENSAHNGDGVFRFRKRKDSRTIAKWTCLGNDKAARELLTLITTALGGDRYVNAVEIPATVVRDRQRSLKVIYVLVRHEGLEMNWPSRSLFGSGVSVDAAGHVSALRAKQLRLPPHVPGRKLNIGKRVSAYFFLAYGKGYRSGTEGEDFDFTDPLYRRNRFHSVLMPGAPLTHPADFIERLRYKGFRGGVGYDRELCSMPFARISRSVWACRQLHGPMLTCVPETPGTCCAPGSSVQPSPYWIWHVT